MLQYFQIKLTRRYICPCPAAVPLSSTDWLMVEVAEAPAGRPPVVDAAPDVAVACGVTMRVNARPRQQRDAARERPGAPTYSCGAGGLRGGAAGRTRLAAGSQTGLRGRRERLQEGKTFWQ